MTLLNVGSAVLYRRDKPRRRSAFVIAGIFLVLLYSRPAGLVLYWTTSNAISLLRNFVEHKLVPRVPAAVTTRLSRLASQE